MMTYVNFFSWWNYPGEKNIAPSTEMHTYFEETIEQFGKQITATEDYNKIQAKQNVKYLYSTESRTSL